MAQTVSQLRKALQEADAQGVEVLARALASDERKGVQEAVKAAQRRIAREQEEWQRLQGLYDFEHALASEHGANLWVGLDEVGRGPLAGPVAVGAVVLPQEALIQGLDDSKKLSASSREQLASEIRENALAYTVVFVDASEIDAMGISAALKKAFKEAVARVEMAGVLPDMVLLDGNPLHLDAREVNVIKGDAQCASISAASIIAKVERDRLMVEYDRQYPEYGFARNKGYGSSDHIEAIKKFGLSPIHRKSFCTAFTQESLF